MFIYNDKEYSSKSAVVRELYDLGKATLDANSKKKLAEELGMTVQTVHATIINYIGKVGVPKQTRVPKTKVNVVETQIRKKVEKKISTSNPIVIDNGDVEVRSSSRRIAVIYAPNQWGLPITVPPLYVIDDNYDPNWSPEPEEDVERNWN